MIGGEGEYEDVAAAVKYVVYGTQNEVKLHRALADATITALVVYAEGETLEEVKASLPNEPPAWIVAFQEAWQTAGLGAMPSFVRERAGTWAGATLPPPPPHVPAAAAPVVGAGGMGVGGAVAVIAPATAAVEDENMINMMAGLNFSEHDKDKLIQDISTQRISGMRILSLSLALMSGHVHPMGEITDLRYGSDLRLCSFIRAQRKAGVESLDDLIKAKQKRHLAQHFTRLAKEYNTRQMIEEATLISQFWAETSAAFEGNDSGLFTYLAEWNRTYAGRGIPKLLDTELILRNLNHKGGSGEAAAEIKELRAAVSSANSKAKSAEEQNSAMLKRLQRLESAGGGGKGQSKTGEGNSKVCFICGSDAHIARDCPNKKGGKGKGGGGSSEEPIDVSEE